MFGLTERELRGTVITGSSNFLDTIAQRDPTLFQLPTPRPDLRDYIETALVGGFPAVAFTRLTRTAREAWTNSYLDQLLTRDAHSLGANRDQRKLEGYFHAVALNSAGVPEHKTLYDAAGVNVKTAGVYDRLLEDLFISETIPAWVNNRLDRLTKTPKRYVVDPALIAAAAGATVETVLADSDLLGQMIDTFVMSQLRPEVALSSGRVRLYHLRTKAGREEIDIVAEMPGGKLIALEVKASASPTLRDAKHLQWLSDQYHHKFLVGAVLHTGPDLFELDRHIYAIPICAFWS